MPELPEVERAASLLRAALVGRTLADVRTFHPSAARHLPARTARTLAGCRVEAVVRRAKIQLATLDDGRTLEIHFRMTGDWAIGPATLPPPPHERVRFDTADGTRVSLVDSRAFALVRVHARNALTLPPLGPEPLDDAWTPAVFAAAIAGRRAPIKPLLLDQRVVAGVGNIYAAEALWEAAIHPATPAGRLSPARIARLVAAVRTVLRAAPDVRYYGAVREVTGHTYAIGEGDEPAWRVYDREGLPCPRCGRPVRRLPQAGRSTYYCGGCQRW